MSGSQRRHSVPEVARILGISERGVRDKIERGQLDAVKDGKRWMVHLPPDVPAEATTASAVAGGSERGSGAVVDAVVTPAEIERAVERTGRKYVTDMAALYDRVSTELSAVYEGQLAAKDQALAAKDEMIAELRRRAEAAETQAALLTQRETVIAAQHETIERLRDEANDVQEEPGFWARVRRMFGGE